MTSPRKGGGGGSSDIEGGGGGCSKMPLNVKSMASFMEAHMQVGNLFIFLFRDGMPCLSSSYNISGLVPACWLLFQYLASVRNNSFVTIIVL